MSYVRTSLGYDDVYCHGIRVGSLLRCDALGFVVFRTATHGRVALFATVDEAKHALRYAAERVMT